MAGQKISQARFSSLGAALAARTETNILIPRSNTIRPGAKGSPFARQTLRVADETASD